MPNRARTHRPPRWQALPLPRESPAKRGYNRRWRRYRDWFLRQPENRYCRITPGCKNPPTIVDHIKPHRGDEELFWDETNHQPACKPCHDRKTARGE